MNFVNFNPSPNISDLIFKDQEVKPPSIQEGGDKPFAQMLEKTIQDKPGEDKIRETEQVKEANETKQIGTPEDRKEINQKNLSAKVKKLLEILEKLISKKELTTLDHSFLSENLYLVKKIVSNLQTGQLSETMKGGLPQPNPNGIDLLAKFLSGETNKLPSEALDQIKKLTAFLQENLFSKGKLSQMEKLTDLIGRQMGENKSIKLEEVYIKNQDHFDVLKGNENKSDGKMVSSSVTAKENSEVRINPTHQKTPTVGNANTSILGKIQNNTVISFSNGSGGESGAGREFSQGFSQSQQPLGRTSGLFSDASPAQPLNFKSLVQYLTGRVHNGFVNGKQVMLVKLQPENLGQVQVLLKKESENSLHLKLKVDSMEIRDLLDKSGIDIKTGLTKENLNLLSFSVDVSDSSQNFHREDADGDEKKFSEFRSISQKDISGDVNVKRVDLRINDNLLNIRI